MYIEVDYNPSPADTFFISAGLNNTEAISFDYTTKGHRVIKQVLTKIKTKEEIEKEPHKSGGWDTLVLKDGEFIKKYHVEWTDKGKFDEVNDEVWETVWEKPLPDSDKKKLLEYSHLISDNYEHLNEDEMANFEGYMKDLVEQYTV